MPSPNASFNDILTTTLRNYSQTLADNVSIHHDVWKRLNRRGKIEPFTGGVKINEDLEYAENGSFKWYSGYETLETTINETFTSAEFDIKQASISVSISGLEEIQNAGEQQVHPLLKRRIQNAEKTMNNNMVRSAFSDGTGDGGKQLTGFQALVSSAPTSGVIGGINRATWTFWRNQKFDGGVDGGAVTSAANIQDYMVRLALRLIRGMDFPDLVVADDTKYRFYTASLTPLQRVTGNDTFGSGFKSLKFFAVGHEVDVIFAGNGVGIPAGYMYFLNTNYLRLRPHSRRNMVPLGGERQPVNQDATVRFIGWAGNMTVSNSALQGLLFN